MVVVKRISPTKIQVGKRVFSQQEFNIAQKFIERKVAGKRGTLTAPSGEFSKRASALVKLFRANPEIQRAIESGSRLRSLALASGFKSTEEFLQLSKFAKPSREEIKRKIFKTRQKLKLKKLLEQKITKKIMLPKKVDTLSLIKKAKIEKKVRVNPLSRVRDIGIDYEKAHPKSKVSTFTIAIPRKIRGEKVFIQDYHFEFRNGKLMEMKAVKRAGGWVTKDHYLKADARRRKRLPKFTERAIFFESKKKPVKRKSTKRKPIRRGAFKTLIKKIDEGKQRKMLKNLEKARAVRMRNLRLKKRKLKGGKKK